MKILDNIEFAGDINDQAFIKGKSGFGAYNDPDGNRIVEADIFIGRLGARFKEMKVYAAEHMGGNFIVSAASLTVSATENIEAGVRCFFDTQGGSIVNQFVIGDGAFSQRFQESGYRYYWMRVTGIGEDYIDLSLTERDSGGFVPQVGDVIIQLGNTTNKSRQGAISISSVGEDSPSITIYGGIDGFSLNEKNIGGSMYDPEREEVVMYGMGSFFFGSPDGKSGISYNSKTGKVSISGEVNLGAGSTGLSNLSEWRNKQKQIDKAQTDASQAIKDAENAQKSAGDAQTAANNASSKAEEAIGGISTLTGTTQNLSTAISALDKAKANAAEVYKKSEADGKISAAEQNAIDAANASLELARQELNEAIAEAKGIADSAVAANSTLDAKITDISNGVTESVAEINARLDGVVENYFEEGDPTDPDNPNNPALKWTEDEKKDHIGDTYTNILSYDKDPDNAGKSWRWTYSDSEHTGYHWHPIADSDAVKALLEASKAQTAADRKSKTFVEQPKNYKKGDLWLLQSDDDHAAGKKGDILTAKQDSETYSASHWEKAVRYTDDTTASAALSTAETAIENASQADTKAQNAQSTANAAQGKLNSWLEDGVISPVEKQAVNNELKNVIADYGDIINDCDRYGIANDSTSPRPVFISSYQSYKSALEKVVQGLDNSEVVSAQELRTAQGDYYMYRSAILNQISIAAKKVADEADRKASEAKTTAEAASNAIDVLNSDNTFSYLEKLSIRSELKEINPSESGSVIQRLFSDPTIENMGQAGWKITNNAPTPFAGWYASSLALSETLAVAEITFDVYKECDITIHIGSNSQYNTTAYALLGEIDDVMLSNPTYTTAGIVLASYNNARKDLSYTYPMVAKGEHTVYVYYRKVSGQGGLGYFRVEASPYANGSLGDYLSLCDKRGISGQGAITAANGLFAYLNAKNIWVDENTRLSNGKEFRDTAYSLFQNYYSELVALRDKLAKSDYDYLTDVFGKGNNLNVEGAVMSQMLAVKNAANGIEAFLNGSDVAKDSTHSKLILAGGIPASVTINGTASINFDDRAKQANTRIYGDGTIYAYKGIFAGEVQMGFQEINHSKQHVYQIDDSPSIWIPVGSVSSTDLNLPNNDAFDGRVLNVFVRPRRTKNEAASIITGHILCPNNYEIENNFARMIEFPNGGFVQLIYSKIIQEWILINIAAKDVMYFQY